MTTGKKRISANEHAPLGHNAIGHASDNKVGSVGLSSPTPSGLISLRHHPSVWLLPAALLILALLPWPYGYYNFLRLSVCAVAAWIAYTQWKHDNALSGWVIVMGATSILYNPFLPIYLTREIWSILNAVSAGLFVGHVWSLRQLVNDQSESGVPCVRTGSVIGENESPRKGS